MEIDLCQTPPKSPRDVPNLQTSLIINGYHQYDDLCTVKNSIKKFIDELRPRIIHFLTMSRFPTWLPPNSVDDENSVGDEIQKFFDDLKIPSVLNNPSLLLHDLGAAANPAIERLFSGPTYQ